MPPTILFRHENGPIAQSNAGQGLTYAMHDKDNYKNSVICIMISDFQPCLYGWWNM